MRDVPMFSVPNPPEPVLSKMYSHFREVKGIYNKYRPKTRVACDECIAVLHEARGVGPAPMAARVSRRGVGKPLRLCGPHAELWRKLDDPT